MVCANHLREFVRFRDELVTKIHEFSRVFAERFEQIEKRIHSFEESINLSSTDSTNPFRWQE
jgi:hypothetical protein